MTAPAVDPNVLAAPASGFGQTVSFAFDPRGEVPQQRPITGSGPRVGASGVSEARRSNPDVRITTPPVDPTATLLMKAGEEVLGKKVEEARNAEFMKGMQRTMAGEALVDVKESVPWYAKVFGDTPVIEGARAYTAQDTVNRALTKQTADLPKLANLNADQAAQHFNKVLSDSMTGDSAADALITKGMIDQMPSLMKAQAKAHYAWNQTNAMTQLASSVNSGAAALQQFGESFAQDTMNDTDFKARSDAFVRAVIPPTGIDEESYKKTLTSSMLRMASAGQFHALEALRTSGITGALDPEQARRIDEAAMTQGAKARDRYAFKFSKELAEIKSDAAYLPDGMTPNDLGKKIDQQNSAYKRLTGSPVDLITSDQKADYLAGTLNYVKRESIKAQERQERLNDRNATAADKATAAAEQSVAINRAIADGEVGLAKVLTKATDDEIDIAFVQATQENRDGAPFIMHQNFVKSGYVNKLIANKFQTEMRLAEGRDAPTDGWFQSVQQYDQMKATGGIEYAASYYGEYGPRLERASRMLNGDYTGGGNSARVFTATMDRTGLNKQQPLDKKSRDEVVKKIQSNNQNVALRVWTGHINMRDDAISTLSDIAAQGAEDWRTADMSDSEAVQQGAAQALRSGRVEVLGGFAIRNPDAQPYGKRPPSIREIMSGKDGTGDFIAVPEDKADEYFKDFIHTKMKVPENVGASKFTRTRDGFVLSARDPETGAALLYPFQTSALREYAAERTKKDTAPGRQGKAAFGAVPTYTADVPNSKNFYISAEERARRQADIDRKARNNHR